jgi:DNA-binding winged helix-turn-helix (wHTH) protein
MNQQEHRTYRFEEIEIDVDNVWLKRSGKEFHIRQQTFQVLVYLLEQRQTAYFEGRVN